MYGNRELLSRYYRQECWGIRFSQFINELSEIAELTNHVRGYQTKGTHLFVRHGEAESNITGTACEKLDEDINKCGLTDLGVDQVMCGTDKLKSLIPKDSPCIFVVSPLRRARETALILQERLQDHLPIVTNISKEMLICDGLSERYYGDMNGMPYNTFRDLVSHHDNKNPLLGFGNSESLLSFQDRITRTVRYLDEMLADYYEQPTTFIHCTHLMVIKMIMASKQDLPLRAMHCMENVPNGGTFSL